MNKTHFDTRAIHAGQEPCQSTGAVMTPIYATSTYKQIAPGEHLGYEYSRTQNPTRKAYEDCIASLESGQKGFAFASGMAAINTVIDLLDSGDHVVAMDDLYGGTFRLFDKVKTRTSNLSFSFIDMSVPENIEAAITPKTKLLWLETPSNPMLKLANLRKIAAIAKKYNLITVADNTFATPWIQRPLELGFDIVLHSATKYLNGHSDVISGVVVVGDNPALSDKIAFLQNSCGAVAGPFDSFLVLRSLKTLSLRMQRHCENANHLANWLSSHPKIEKVIYPGLKSHPQYSLAKEQMKDFGGMISLVLKGSLEDAKRFLARCELFTLAESLGGVESLIEHPAIMTHASIPVEQRKALGIEDGFIRLSVGIEHIDDLRADLEHALG
ncbi:TPA: aminotransferase class I/II-fold pyridoxal phosphate-dependent enzyme [Legionella pneumophila subsp. pneumophila]|uniref:Cystathionine beta-lyase n=1 Tax=Legionella pneumophila TaxID=446 RepID=A0A378K3D3_LEGPN|nr:PLP-dependent aspartate aminotransferase family protein [Legionella pneumophila]MCZ4724896.1 PLP-dependent aspartate aminotransferase family protein [Legionella pneumophila]MDW9138805.1 PLP-dependent aspartate aminotransferase family protein [Legionella pneumophila]MDW9164258.1 PLP-dependent aspartate aminotransferase family protein [Legionella pneumophila]CZG58574.1 Cystathionine beta-lyase [Legionella pneumophila]CZI47410.1 Cystathionine beta-lyase [Legionella pneumophila]